jgi:hypothetical protein
MNMGMLVNKLIFQLGKIELEIYRLNTAKSSADIYERSEIQYRLDSLYREKQVLLASI